MKRLILAALALLCATPALADPSGGVAPGTSGTQSWLSGCVYRSTPITAVNGQQMALGCGPDGTLITTAGGGGGGGGTSSTFGSAFPATGTASGFKDATGALMAPGNLDASGFLKVNVAAGGAGGGAVYGPTAVGSPAANPPVLIGGTTNGLAGGNVSVAQVIAGIQQMALASAIPTGSNQIGHVVSDTGSTTAVTQATASALNATVVGTGTFAVQNTASIPAGSAVIGHVISDTGSTTAVTQATAANLNATVVGTGTFAVQNTAATPTGANSIGTVGLNAGTNLVGKVGIDQTTPGTTNGVQINAALPAGANTIGNTGGLETAGSAVTGGGNRQMGSDGTNARDLLTTTGGSMITTPLGIGSVQVGSSITTFGTFQSALASSTTRRGCLFVNTSTDVEYVYFGTTGAATTANSIPLVAGQSLSCAAGGIVLTDNIAVTSKTTSGATYVLVSQ